MAENSRFWDRIAAKYAASPVSDEASYQKKLEATRRFLTPQTEMLEYGCGTGSTAITHAPHVRHIRATDISQAMLDIARGKAEAAGIGNISFECTSIEALQAEDAGYDVILAMSILHLVADPDAVLAKTFAMLRPGGRFLSSTTCLKDLPIRWLLLPVGAIGRLTGLLPLLTFFSRAELEAKIAAAGFEIEDAWQPGKGRAVFIVARKPG